MIKITLTLSFMLFLSIVAFGQRLNHSDIETLIKLNNRKDAISQITRYLKIQAPNWVEPIEVPDKDVFIVKWNYKYQQTALGDLTFMYFKSGPIPFKLRYRFPYKAQYVSLLNGLPPDSELINEFTNNGADYKIYETADVTFVFITYPANLNMFFRDGKPTECYAFELHNKVD